MDDTYWARPCGCGADVGHTNLQCVTQAAHDTRTTLEEAMRIFRPPDQATTMSAVNDKWVNWGTKHKVEDT